MNQRRMSAKERKQAIVRAALPLFARKGFAETTTRELARAAGVSEPLLYKHFPSKEALYDEIQDYCCQGTDAVSQRLAKLKPSTSTLVHLVYHLMRALVLGLPGGTIDWDTKHRLMVKSLLEEGDFARHLYKNRFACFCSQIEASLTAATVAGDVVSSPVKKHNLALFAHHVGAWIAMAHLPRKAAMDYKSAREQLLNQAVWFVLRGMGMTDKALANHYNPEALALAFVEK